MPADPKPKKGAYAAKRKRDKKAAKWLKAYGSEAYAAAVRGTGCYVARHSWYLYADGTVRGGLPPEAIAARLKSCSGAPEAAHVVKKTRPDDPLATHEGLACLCSQHHAEQEKGLEVFEERYGILGGMVKETVANVSDFGYLVQTGETR